MTEDRTIAATPTPSQRATLLVAVGSATVAFMLGFNGGAFGVIFFDQLLIIWVIATIVFVGSIVSDLPPSTWPRRLILLTPSLWVIAAAIDNAIEGSSGEGVVFALTVVVTLAALPFAGWVLVAAINADFTELPMRNKLIVIAAVAVAVVVGFGIGARNDLLLNCNDFKVSGNDLPENCLQLAPEG